MVTLEIGDVVVFTSGEEIGDVTFGKAYEVSGIHSDGDPYFIDDIGEKDYALVCFDNSFTLTSKRSIKLERDSLFLQCLESAGVDNWEGYDEAVRTYKICKEAVC